MTGAGTGFAARLLAAALSAAALLPAGAAGAACPVAADLGAGITITYTTQTVTLRRLSPLVVQSLTESTDGALRAQTDLALGLLPLVTLADFSDPAIPDQQTSYNLDPAALVGRLPPPAGQSLSLAAQVTDLATGQTDDVEIAIVAGQPGQITLAGCPLAILPLTIRFERPGQTHAARLAWVADLGIALQTERSYRDLPAETLTPLTIEPR